MGLARIHHDHAQATARHGFFDTGVFEAHLQAELRRFAGMHQANPASRFARRRGTASRAYPTESTSFALPREGETRGGSLTSSRSVDEANS
jgi:hypothetical protein